MRLLVAALALLAALPSAMEQQAPKRLEDWSKDDVFKWLTSEEGCDIKEEEAQYFRSDKIDGACLHEMLLDGDDNVKDEITKLGNGIRRFVAGKIVNKLRALEPARQEQSTPNELSVEDIPKAQPAGIQVVHIVRTLEPANKPRKIQWVLGSGLYTELDGVKYILTNNHVIQDRQQASDSFVVFGYDKTCRPFDYDGLQTARLDPKTFYTGGGRYDPFDKELTKEQQGGNNTTFGNDWTFVKLANQDLNPTTKENTAIDTYKLDCLMAYIRAQKEWRIAENGKITCHHHAEGHPRHSSDLRSVPRCLYQDLDSSFYEPAIAFSKYKEVLGYGHGQALKLMKEQSEGLLVLGKDMEKDYVRYREVRIETKVKGGASGSPLWDEDGRLIGIIAGGLSTPKVPRDATFATGCHIDHVLRGIDVALEAQRKYNMEVGTKIDITEYYEKLMGELWNYPLLRLSLKVGRDDDEDDDNVTITFEDLVASSLFEVAGFVDHTVLPTVKFSKDDQDDIDWMLKRDSEYQPVNRRYERAFFIKCMANPDAALCRDLKASLQKKSEKISKIEKAVEKAEEEELREPTEDSRRKVEIEKKNLEIEKRFRKNDDTERSKKIVEAFEKGREMPGVGYPIKSGADGVQQLGSPCAEWKSSEAQWGLWIEHAHKTRLKELTDLKKDSKIGHAAKTKNAEDLESRPALLEQAHAANQPIRERRRRRRRTRSARLQSRETPAPDSVEQSDEVSSRAQAPAHMDDARHEDTLAAEMPTPVQGEQQEQAEQEDEVARQLVEGEQQKQEVPSQSAREDDLNTRQWVTTSVAKDEEQSDDVPSQSTDIKVFERFVIRDSRLTLEPLPNDQ